MILFCLYTTQFYQRLTSSMSRVSHSSSPNLPCLTAQLPHGNSKCPTLQLPAGNTLFHIPQHPTVQYQTQLHQSLTTPMQPRTPDHIALPYISSPCYNPSFNVLSHDIPFSHPTQHLPQHHTLQHLTTDCHLPQRSSPRCPKPESWIRSPPSTQRPISRCPSPQHPTMRHLEMPHSSPKLQKTTKAPHYKVTARAMPQPTTP